MSGADDAARVAEMLRGSAAAFDGIFLRHAGSVRRIALSMLQTPEAADDLVQEVFAFLWEHGDKYDCERGDLAHWLRAIARNRASDVLRARARDQRLVESAGGHARTVAAPPGPLEAMIVAERASRLHAALAGLPRAHRQALILAYARGLSHRELAEATGVPLGTVKSRLRLSKQQLALRLAPESQPDVLSAA